MEASDWFCVYWGVAKDDIISITPEYEYKTENICVYSCNIQYDIQ